jgi:GNAT superfamily N-acetyltransferase
MLADTAALAPQLYRVPDAELLRVTTPEHATMAMDLNTRAYGMPDFITASVVESGAYFRDPSREFGYVALASGTPVATAAVIELDGWLYVAAVATAPDHRNKGYAELVMRQALRAASAAAGITRTALDASLLGSTLYAQMGYQATGGLWRMYVSA